VPLLTRRYPTRTVGAIPEGDGQELKNQVEVLAPGSEAAVHDSSVVGELARGCGRRDEVDQGVHARLSEGQGEDDAYFDDQESTTVVTEAMCPCAGWRCGRRRVRRWEDRGEVRGWDPVGLGSAHPFERLDPRVAVVVA
jgi:hypothetical protein